MNGYDIHMLDVDKRSQAPLAVIDSLIVDFLGWLATRPRRYAEVMEAWRTSCPRLTVWEDATDAGFVAHGRDGEGQAVVELTPRGRRLLDAAGRR